MNAFKEKLLRNKKVSVWGLGYLGYTTILRLQSKGFFVNVFDFNFERVEEIQKNEYPKEPQKVSWTKRGDIPSLDLLTIDFLQDTQQLFDSNVHIIAIPFDDENILKISEIFIENKEILKNSLIIFQSAGVPGSIKKLLKGIDENNIATAFREDWNLEEFFSENSKRVIAADCESAQEKIEFFFELFDLETKTLNSIKEAEILANAKRSLSCTINGFLNQLSFAYPDTNLKELSKLILEDISESEVNVSIGSSRFKEATANNNLMNGTRKEDALSLVKDASSSNLSLLLYYGDLILKKGYTKVAIYGISGEGDIKEIRVSPSIILAEYLHTQGIKVSINDPFFSEDELNKILPFAQAFLIEESVESDVIIFMASHREYKYLTMNDLRNLNILDGKLIIDNTEIFKDFTFPKEVNYHIAGDGRLGELES